MPLERAKILPKKPGLFPKTDWLIIGCAPGASEEKIAAAREEICRIYWPPVFHVISSSGIPREEAEDLTQGFWLRFFQSNAAARADPAKGRFRDFLRGAVDHYLADQRDRARTRRRGGGAPHFSLDEAGAVDPAALSAAGTDHPGPCQADREWAMNLLQRALQRLEEKYSRAGRGDLCRLLKPLCFAEKDERPTRYARLAAELGRTEGALRSEAARLRKRLRALLAEELQREVAPDRFPEEWEGLLEILRSVD